MYKLSLLAAGIFLSVNVLAAPQTNEPIQPIQPAKIDNPAKVELASSYSSIRACPSPASFPATPATT